MTLIFVHRSKKYIVTLVPIFVVGPAMAVAGFFLRHRLVSLAKRCCGRKSQSDDKDFSKVTIDTILKFKITDLVLAETK